MADAGERPSWASTPTGPYAATPITRLSTCSSSSTVEWRVARRPQDLPARVTQGSRAVPRPRPHPHHELLRLANVLPPLFVCLIIATIWAVHVGFHLMPLLQVHLPASQRRQEEFQEGIWQLVISQTLTTGLFISYVRAVLTFPGTVPDRAEWKLGGLEADAVQGRSPLTKEVKLTGERRHCKWCLRYKPDRCHHCRVCGLCVLKMDHHCPWIMNCVGFRNHKYFFLLVFYSVVDCAFIGWSLCRTARMSAYQEMSMSNRFVLVLGSVLVVIMGSLLTLFFSFHTYLMCKGLTTIEYCEKNTLALTGLPLKRQSYDRGFYRNLVAVLGSRPMLWFLPCCPPEGDGTSFGESTSVDDPEPEVDPEWTSARGPCTRM